MNNTCKEIRFAIDSKLENVPFVGMAINKICSSILLSDIDSYQVELCTVEAVNNCIEHAYELKSGHDIEIVLSAYPDKISIDIYDSGISMNPKSVEQEVGLPLEVIPPDMGSLPEQGRGLPLMKEIMDNISYKTEGGKNCLTLVKKI